MKNNKIKPIEMFVCLKMPDNTAITALQALQLMGFSGIKGVKRYDYYKFELGGSAEGFKKKISRTDIIVNANKHSFSFSAPKNGNVKVLVQDIEDGGGLAASLRKLGFRGIKNAGRGVLWELGIGGSRKEALATAEKAAKSLLMNEHYQRYRIM